MLTNDKRNNPDTCNFLLLSESLFAGTPSISTKVPTPPLTKEKVPHAASKVPVTVGTKEKNDSTSINRTTHSKTKVGNNR